MSTRYHTAAHSVVYAERSSALPVAGLGISFRIGSLLDPAGREGLTRLWLRALRMGTTRLRSQALEERLDAIGGVLSTSCSQSYVHVGGVVLAERLPQFVELLAELLKQPAFRPKDFAQVKRESLAGLSALSDDDGSLLRRHFRSYALGKHAYGRPTRGYATSLRAISRAEVIAHHERMLTGPNLIFGVWGDFKPGPLRALLDRHFGDLPRRRPPRRALKEVRWPRGRRLLIIDKPERVQTQVGIGTLGTHPPIASTSRCGSATRPSAGCSPRG